MLLPVSWTPGCTRNALTLLIDERLVTLHDSALFIIKLSHLSNFRRIPIKIRSEWSLPLAAIMKVGQDCLSPRVCRSNKWHIKIAFLGDQHANLSNNSDSLVPSVSLQIVAEKTFEAHNCEVKRNS